LRRLDGEVDDLALQPDRSSAVSMPGFEQCLEAGLALE